jgi:CBS domain-containing protein
MNVAAILKSKGSRVVSVRPGDSVGEVCRVLVREGIGAALVLDQDGKVAGVVSERDVMRGLANHGEMLPRLPVERLMTREVVCCSPDDTIDSVMQRMTGGRFRHLPVLRDGRLVGIVSIGDVVKQRIAETELEAQELRRYIASG